MSILTAEYWLTARRVFTAITVSAHCWWRFHASGAEFVHHVPHRMICLSPTKRAVKFAEHLHENVLEDVPNRHVVFAIPRRLRGYFRYDRKLNTVLFQAAWGSMAAVLGCEDAVPAGVLTIQTAGEALNFHPHLHGALADGVFYPDGKFQRFAVIDQGALIAEFRDRVLSSLSDKQLLDDADIAQILSQKHSGFNV